MDRAPRTRNRRSPIPLYPVPPFPSSQPLNNDADEGLLSDGFPPIRIRKSSSPPAASTSGAPPPQQSSTQPGDGVSTGPSQGPPPSVHSRDRHLKASRKSSSDGDDSPPHQRLRKRGLGRENVLNTTRPAFHGQKRFRLPQSPTKHDADVIDMIEKRASKRRRLNHRTEEGMEWLREEVKGIKENLREILWEVQDSRREVYGMFAEYYEIDSGIHD